MSVSDPIADMLTRIRNASNARHEKVDVPASRMKNEIAKVLKEAGYVKNFKIIRGEKQDILRIYLKYDENNRGIINLKRISKPGRRVYVDRDHIPRVLNGLGISILTTSRGILTDREARRSNVGGEVLCYVW
ncbi:MAG: 30S ribosomal protein S8 [Deltaproteobacteria bacterium]|nr:30S ribosomal protein S8 [Deltaproteobacteria bacterium]MBW2120732.1 30S ribosomal protein S8 [Deltaproteobacteria bacterium]